MKLTFLKKIAFGLLAAVVVAFPAAAQTYSRVTSVSTAGFDVRQGVITSATAVTNGAVADASRPLFVIVSGTTVGTAILTPVLADGTPGGAVSQTISVNIVTPTIISYTAGLPFQAIRLSPTTALSGVNSVTVKMVQPPR